MSTTQRHTVRSRVELADAYVDGLFAGTDWSVLHGLIQDGLARGAFGAATVSRFLAACVSNEAVRRRCCV